MKASDPQKPTWPGPVQDILWAAQIEKLQFAAIREDRGELLEMSPEKRQKIQSLITDISRLSEPSHKKLKKVHRLLLQSRPHWQVLCDNLNGGHLSFRAKLRITKARINLNGRAKKADELMSSFQRELKKHRLDAGNAASESKEIKNARAKHPRQMP